MDLAVKRHRSGSAARRDRAELVAAAVIIVLVAAAAFWLIDSIWTQQKVTGRFTADPPSEILGEVYCRPGCRNAFERCEVTALGFPFQQSRCQETLKSCMIGCGTRSQP